VELIRGLKSLKPKHRGSVASIGNFDGVHLGHLAVLAELKAKARELHLPATVVLFEPMPQEYFAPERAPIRLTRFGEKWPLLEAADVERVLCLHFDQALATLAPEEFIRRVLIQGLGVEHLTVGDDFRFGRERSGDFAMLQSVGGRQGFEVETTASFMLEGARVSSSRIRSLLMEGELEAAARLLGRPYGLSGHVIYGEKLGRTLGFPTANIALGRKQAPVSGIFVSRVHGVETRPLPGVSYVGVRPALGGTHPVLETYLPGYSREIYGRRLRVDLLHRLREDRHFDSLDALVAQMQKDVQAATAWHADHTS